MMHYRKAILSSWQANAQNWIATIDNNEVESRFLVTNDAIITTILNYQLQKILDLGCGEGWLSRSLRDKGIEAYGTDAIKELIETAIEKDTSFYFQYSYEEIITGKHQLPSDFDAAVINFALLDEETTEKLIHYLPFLLKENGLVFIQILHPLVIAYNDDYKSGWKNGSWTGMKRDFVQPYQWYFRTTEDWVKLFIQAGFDLKEIREPVHPSTGKPLSIIFVLRATNIKQQL
jgi:2-polyprenyl-3-methyl-5-hydroxy-6-metoxy-1,4-benzoquinol methylase